ncbi:MAG: DUF1269 domain-containing protein [Terriglobales bacterium]
MEKMLVVVFDNETKAYEGSRALNQLDFEGSITIHAKAVISKNSDGTVTVKQGEDDFPVRTVSGTAIGSLIGLLGGPAGLAVGALAGTMAGSLADLFVAGVDSDFLPEVSKMLTPSKYAIVADISEEWVTPVDTKMEALNGFVFRTARKSFEEAQRVRDIAELRAEIDQLKAEHARAKAEHKAKLQAKIDGLNTRLQTKLQQGRQRSEQIKNETEAKVQALQQKAAKARGDAKTAIDARVTEIKKQYDRWVEQANSMVA